MPTSELLDHFIRGLKPAVKLEIERTQALGLCGTLEEVIQMAERMDAILFSAQAKHEPGGPGFSKSREDHRGKGPPHAGGGSFHGPSKSTQFASVPSNGDKPKKKWLSDKEREQFKKEGCCFHCHELCQQVNF